ncbi:MAG: hypothetical protein R2749_26860 [Acidimicrobiales bacterium]
MAKSRLERRQRTLTTRQQRQLAHVCPDGCLDVDAGVRQVVGLREPQEPVPPGNRGGEQVLLKCPATSAKAAANVLVISSSTPSITFCFSRRLSFTSSTWASISDARSCAPGTPQPPAG